MLPQKPYHNQPSQKPKENHRQLCKTLFLWNKYIYDSTEDQPWLHNCDLWFFSGVATMHMVAYSYEVIMQMLCRHAKQGSEFEPWWPYRLPTWGGGGKGPPPGLTFASTGYPGEGELLPWTVSGSQRWRSWRKNWSISSCLEEVQCQKLSESERCS